MGIKQLLLFVFCLLLLDVHANTYVVYLKDKEQSTFTLKQPQQFLSEKAIERRRKLKIELSSTDLPVSTAYTQTICNYPVQMHFSLKWLNCIVLDASPGVVAQLILLPFVLRVEEIKSTNNLSAKTNDKFETLSTLWSATQEEDAYYGNSLVQNVMIRVDFLHKKGFKGDGVMVAHFDNGCFNAKNMVAFDSLFKTNRFLGSRDIVDGDLNVFDDGTHGTSTLSCLTAKEPGKYVGSAPHASYFLFRTEDNSSETIQEEYNWVYAAEVADSIGVDVFTTSLGYTTFDGGIANHAYSDMDGNTTPITKAANRAASLGIIVVNSAGNEGAKPWHYIAAPADGDSVLAVGAVNGDRKIASFSSFGPNASGKIKPDVCAMGWGAAVYDPSGAVFASNGTSFSGPIMAGGLVCLRQAFPAVANVVILDAVRRSAHLFKHPNDSLGYGIPDLAIAYYLLDDYVRQFPENRVVNTVFPNPFQRELSIYVQHPTEPQLTAEVYDFSGRMIFSQLIPLENNQSQFVTIDAGSLNSGAYLLRIRGNKYYDVQRIEKQ